MPVDHQVTCINKADRYNAHERILNIGGSNSDRTHWKLSQQDAIAGIESGTWSFFVSVNGGSPELLSREAHTVTSI